MDEEIRKLQRLAPMQDREARNKLFRLIRCLAPEFGMTERRPYRCALCGHEQLEQTNHTGPIYGIYCGICTWKGMRDKKGEYHEPTGRMFEYSGYEPKEGWECVCDGCPKTDSFLRNPQDEYIRSIIRKARAGDENAWSKIEAALQRSLIRPEFFYIVEINLGDNTSLHYTATKEAARKLVVEQAREYFQEMENEEYPGWLAELGYRLNQMDDTEIIKAWQHESPLIWQFEIRKTFFE